MVMVVAEGSVILCSTGPTTTTPTAPLAPLAATKQMKKTSQERPTDCSQIPGINKCTAVRGDRTEEQTLGAAGLTQPLRQDCGSNGMEKQTKRPAVNSVLLASNNEFLRRGDEERGGF